MNHLAIDIVLLKDLKINMAKILENLEKYILLAVIFLLPLGFSTMFVNVFDFPKTIILVFGLGLVIIFKAFNTLAKGELKLSSSPIDFPLFFLAVAFIASTFIRTPNKMEALVIPGVTTTFIGIVFLYFLSNSLDIKDRIVNTVVFSGAMVSGISILAFFKVFASIPQASNILKIQQFSTVEGLLSQAIFLATILPLGFYAVAKGSNAGKKTLSLVASVLILFGLILSIYNILPGKPASPKFVSFQTSWSVAVDALKENPIFGVGPGNYLTAFNRFRPITYNSTDLWSTRFTVARNWPFTVLTETGLFGFAAFVLIAYKVVKIILASVKEKEFKIQTSTLPLVSLVLISVLLILFPANFILVALLFLVLLINLKSNPFTVHLSAFMYGPANSKPSKIIAYFVAIPAILAIGVLYFFSGRAVLGEFTFKKAVDAANANDGKKTYELLQTAISLNPMVDRYRVTYAQVNIALANNIAASEKLTDEQKQTVSQLVQQAIREAKTTAALNISRSSNWEILARTYQGIIPLAQGSDAFAIQSYNQAIALDPYNPTLRIALGGLFYAQGKYDDAIKSFELATIAKSDLANAHYNLAIALREKGETARAIEEMKNTLALVEEGSSDYNVAKEELEKLENKSVTGPATQESETLTTPVEQEPVIEPKVSLPEDASPPSPSPTPLP